MLYGVATTSRASASPQDASDWNLKRGLKKKKKKKKKKNAPAGLDVRLYLSKNFTAVSGAHDPAGISDSLKAGIPPFILKWFALTGDLSKSGYII
jgi:hypothetical protein